MKLFDESDYEGVPTTPSSNQLAECVPVCPHPVLSSFHSSEPALPTQLRTNVRALVYRSSSSTSWNRQAPDLRGQILDRLESKLGKIKE